VPGGLGQGLLIIDHVADELTVGRGSSSGTTLRMAFTLP
jgi:hypothetical protein